MKYSILLTFAASFALQTGVFAQPYSYQNPYQNRPAPQLEVQVQRLPDDDYYYRKSGATDIRWNYREDPRNRSYPQPTRNGAYRQESYRTNPYEANQYYNYNTESQPVNSDQPSNSTIIDNTKPQTLERTLSILKPDAVKNRHIGDIISRFEDNGLRVVGIKMIRLTPDQAAQFYNIHRDRPFFKDLVQFMSSGPVVVIVLEGEDAISKNRQLMGSTDPKKAEKGTIRADYAESISQNAVHGSDSIQTAGQEIPFFFRPNELYSGY